MHVMSTLRSILAHPANRGHSLTAVARYLGWQVSKRLGARYWDIPFHGLTLRCHRDSHSASAAMYFSGMPDFREMCFMQRYLRPGDTFLDVGANVGVYTMIAAALVGASGSVHAFEPGAATAMRLRENIDLNALRHVSVHELALSDRDGSALLDNGCDDCVASLVPQVGTTSDSHGMSVRCARLDTLLPDTQAAMAKLDVEGAEPLVVRGARSLMARGVPPVMQIEMDGYCRKFGIETHSFIAELSDQGYDTGFYDVPANRIIYTLRPWEQHIVNVLAVSRAHRHEVERRLASAVAQVD